VVTIPRTIRPCAAPGQKRYAVQYTLGRRTVVLAWNTGALDGLGQVPGRDVRFPLRGLDPAALYRCQGAEYSGAHLASVGLPVAWTETFGAAPLVLEAQ
jgi:alpha-galactosidase